MSPRSAAKRGRPLDEASVLSALEARRSYIREHAATVSTSVLLHLIADDLGLAAGGGTGGIAALSPFKAAVRERALALLEAEGQMPASAAPADASDLPAELLPAVFKWLDHDSLFSALQVSRAWRAACAPPATGDLWERQCSAHGWASDAPAAAPGQQQQQQQQQQQVQQQHEPPPSSVIDFQALYRQRYAAACYDCFAPTQRHTLPMGTLRLRLCRACSSGYVGPRAEQRLMAAAAAKRKCCLKEEDLAGLPYCVEPNPVNDAFAPMHLYRRLDVRRAALARWGSWEAVQAEHQRRITRS